LVEALRTMAADPQLRQSMAATCRSVALEQFTAEAMAARYEALYREVRGS
jgi:glycosyltransferase involved in cell wall biosynthesis